MMVLEQQSADRIAALRQLADNRSFPAPAERKKRLIAFRELLRHRHKAIAEALRDDLGKDEFESITTELMPLLQILNLLISNVKRWSKPRRSPVSPLNFPGYGRLIPEPYGLVLTVATWNYPLLLALEPLLGAYAAGNQVVLKLSPRSTHTMRFIRWAVEECFDDDEVAVIGGEVELAALAEVRFDYAFYTGSTAGGAEILRQCAGNLTPATIESGGKCPCVVDSGANLRVAARRIVWGKFSNAGQTCVAPDYLLVAKNIKEPLVAELKSAIRKFYGDSPLESVAPLVDDAAYERVGKLAGHGRLLAGGDKDPTRRAIAPTIIDRLAPDDPLLTQEIFGPVLPMTEFRSPEELFVLLNRRKKPLALYYFGSSETLLDELTARTSSGAVVSNDVVTHFINRDMPFGGVGDSGMGAYHGKATFDTFTHFKPVMYRSTWFDSALRYPPHRKHLTRLLAWFLGLK